MSEKRIDEELVSADCLANYLRNKGGCNKVLVERNEDDPPDFWFTIDDKKYAVEVTSIVTCQGYHANIKRLTQTIKKASQESGILTGKYVLIIVRKPNIPRRNSAAWHNLVNCTLLFMQLTKEAVSTDPIILYKDSNGYIQIKKTKQSDKNGSTLGCLFISPMQWEEEAQAELTKLMQKAIDEKRRKLLNKGVTDICPNNIILLFYDAYGYCELDDAQKALSNVEGYKWFHSIFWAASFTNRQNELYKNEPGRLGIFLYSTNRNWCENPQINEAN